MEVIGKVIVAFPETSGTAKATGNPWKKREYVLETLDTYPRKVHFDFFGERADQFPLNVGDTIKLSFDIESREYNGKWYTSIRGWKSEPYVAGAPAAAAAPAQQYGGPSATPIVNEPAIPEPPVFGGDSSDDLPF